MHLLCAANRVPLSYELTPANVAEVYLTEELLAEARLGDGLARKLFGDLAYRSGDLKRGADRVRHPAGHRALGEATWRTATRRDRPGESQARVRARGDTGHHAHWLGDANRGKDSGLHLRFSGQPAFGSASGKDQGALG